MTKAGRALAALPSRWPVRGAVNSEFGNRPSPWTSGNTEFHAGLDIKADRGTPVYALAAGSVVHAGTATEYGTAAVPEHQPRRPHALRSSFQGSTSSPASRSSVAR